MQFIAALGGITLFHSHLKLADNCNEYLQTITLILSKSVFRNHSVYQVLVTKLFDTIQPVHHHSRQPNIFQIFPKHKEYNLKLLTFYQILVLLYLENKSRITLDCETTALWNGFD